VKGTYPACIIGSVSEFYDKPLYLLGLALLLPYCVSSALQKVNCLPHTFTRCAQILTGSTHFIFGCCEVLF